MLLSDLSAAVWIHEESPSPQKPRRAAGQLCIQWASKLFQLSAPAIHDLKWLLESQLSHPVHPWHRQEEGTGEVGWCFFSLTGFFQVIFLEVPHDRLHKFPGQNQATWPHLPVREAVHSATLIKTGAGLPGMNSYYVATDIPVQSLSHSFQQNKSR